MKNRSLQTSTIIALCAFTMFTLSGFGKDVCGHETPVSLVYTIGAGLMCAAFLIFHVNYSFGSRVLGFSALAPLLAEGFYFFHERLLHTYFFGSTALIFLAIYLKTKESGLIRVMAIFSNLSAFSILVTAKCVDQTSLYGAVSLLLLTSVVSLLGLEDKSAWIQVVFRGNQVVITTIFIAAVATLLYFASPVYIYLLISIFFMPTKRY